MKLYISENILLIEIKQGIFEVAYSTFVSTYYQWY